MGKRSKLSLKKNVIASIICMTEYNQIKKPSYINIQIIVEPNIFKFLGINAFIEFGYRFVCIFNYMCSFG